MRRGEENGQVRISSLPLAKTASKEREATHLRNDMILARLPDHHCGGTSFNSRLPVFSEVASNPQIHRTTSPEGGIEVVTTNNRKSECKKSAGRFWAFVKQRRNASVKRCLQSHSTRYARKGGPDGEDRTDKDSTIHVCALPLPQPSILAWVYFLPKETPPPLGKS